MDQTSLLNSREKEQIAAWGRRVADTPRITLKRSDAPPGPDMLRFCRELVDLAPAVRMERESAEEHPEIQVAANIAYRGIPAGRELAPFLEALAGEAAVEQIPELLQAELAGLEIPASLTLYVAPQCPHCPLVARQLLALARLQPAVRLTVVDAAAFGKQAATDGIRSVPTVLLDGSYRWSGQPDTAELVAMMRDRDPSALGPEALRGMLEEGAAAAVARMMAEAGQVFAAFIDLLAHDKWPVRLGALVALEHLVEADPHLATGVVAPLRERFEGADENTRGDILLALGEAGGFDLIPDLESIAIGPYDGEIREAAVEAVETIRDREKKT